MRCPTCKKTSDASPANRYRPFCSERCQMIDLGTWASEEYTVPGGNVDDHEHPDDGGPSASGEPAESREARGVIGGKKLLH
ncbi:MAG: DNA gyrase inhibitor YacG [Candidatus Binataceae bacterium]